MGLFQHLVLDFTIEGLVLNLLVHVETTASDGIGTGVFLRAWKGSKTAYHTDEISRLVVRSFSSDPSLETFYADGSRRYDDGGVVEVATPEVSNATEAALRIRASDILVCRKTQTVAAEQAELLGEPVAFHVIKQAINPMASPRGTHENYAVSSDLWSTVAGGMLGFLTVRGLITDPGGVVSAGDSAWAFVRNSKAAWSQAGILKDYTLFRSKDRGESCLEIRCYGPNHSDSMNRLKFGMTDFVLNALECMAFDKVDPLDELYIPGRQFDKLQNRDTMLVSWRNKDIETSTSHNVLDHYRNLIDRYLGGDLDEDDRWVLEKWDHYAGLLSRNELDQTVGGLEWTTLQAMLKKANVGSIERNGRPLTYAEAAKATVFASIVTVDPGLQRKIDSRCHGVRENGRLFDDRVAEEALAYPPPDTRAAVRGALVSRVYEMFDPADDPNIAVQADWEAFGVLDLDKTRVDGREGNVIVPVLHGLDCDIDKHLQPLMAQVERLRERNHPRLPFSSALASAPLTDIGASNPTTSLEAAVREDLPDAEEVSPGIGLNYGLGEAEIS